MILKKQNARLLLLVSVASLVIVLLFHGCLFNFGSKKSSGSGNGANENSAKGNNSSGGNSGGNSARASKTSAVAWFHSYDRGRRVARKEDMKMFVIITAPSWCGPCRYMENKTFPDARVIKTLNQNFVSVKVLDKKDGKRNPDLKKFKFRGFPTYMIYDESGNMLYQKAGGIGPKQLLNILNKYI